MFKGTEIHPFAKIIGMVDVYEALSHPRTYRKDFIAYEALQKIIQMRNTHFDPSIIKAMINEMRDGPGRAASLHNVECADAVLVLGEDLTNTAPMLALAVRQAIRSQPLKRAEKQHIMPWQDAAVREMLQEEHGPFFQATVSSTKLDGIATASPTMAQTFEVVGGSANATCRVNDSRAVARN